MDNHGHYRGKVGKLGEAETVEWLVSQGYTVLERNWRSRHLEVDIICMDAAGVHFVEVKSRRSGDVVSPEERVGVAKIRRIAAAAARYMRAKHICEECHFDVASVTFNGFGAEVRFIPDAFIPIYL